jgi:hypothetical protein
LQAIYEAPRGSGAVVSFQTLGNDGLIIPSATGRECGVAGKQSLPEASAGEVSSNRFEVCIQIRLPCLD